MRFSLNICEKHYGTAVVEAESCASTHDMAQDAINEGNVIWTKTEIDSVAVKPEVTL